MADKSLAHDGPIKPESKEAEERSQSLTFSPLKLLGVRATIALGAFVLLSAGGIVYYDVAVVSHNSVDAGNFNALVANAIAICAVTVSFILVVLTYSIFNATSRAVNAATIAATATQHQVDLLKEANAVSRDAFALNAAANALNAEEREVQTAPYVTVSIARESADEVTIALTSISNGPALDVHIEVILLYSYKVGYHIPFNTRGTPLILRVADMRVNDLEFCDGSYEMRRTIPVLPKGETYYLSVKQPAANLFTSHRDEVVEPESVADERDIEEHIENNSYSRKGTIALQTTVSYRSAFAKSEHRRSNIVSRVLLTDGEEPLRMQLVRFSDPILRISLAISPELDHVEGYTWSNKSSDRSLEQLSIDEALSFNGVVSNAPLDMIFDKGARALIWSFGNRRSTVETEREEQIARGELLQALGFSERLVSLQTAEDLCIGIMAKFRAWVRHQIETGTATDEVRAMVPEFFETVVPEVQSTNSQDNGDKIRSETGAPP